MKIDIKALMFLGGCMFEVVFYEKGSGEKPVEDFIDSLEPKMRAKLVSVMEILEEKGNMLRMPYSQHIEDGIFEVRAKVGSNISRVMCFFYYGRKIIMTNGFIKKTQKTPKNEIDLAKKYRKEFLKGKGDNS